MFAAAIPAAALPQFFFGRTSPIVMGYQLPRVMSVARTMPLQTELSHSEGLREPEPIRSDSYVSLCFVDVSAEFFQCGACHVRNGGK